MLASHVVLNMAQVAWALQLVGSRGEAKGQPDPQKARDLVRAGAVRLVDPSQPVSRWTVAADEIRRYIQHGPRSPRFDVVDGAA